MKRTAVVAAALMAMVAISAYAGGGHHPPSGPRYDQDQHQGQAQGQLQGQGQHQHAEGGNGYGGHGGNGYGGDGGKGIGVGVGVGHGGAGGHAESDARAAAGAIAGSLSHAEGGHARGGDAHARGGEAYGGEATGGEASSNQEQSQSANNEGNTQTVGGSHHTTSVSNHEENPDNIKIRNTPTVYSAPAVPTSPCRIGGSAGGSLPGLGISLGGSTMDWECNRRETAHAFAQLGAPAMGLKILCESKAVTHKRHGAGITTSDCEAMVAKMMAPDEDSATRDDITHAVSTLSAHVTGEHQATRTGLGRAIVTGRVEPPALKPGK